jgi:hypothetical protein
VYKLTAAALLPDPIKIMRHIRTDKDDISGSKLIVLPLTGNDSFSGMAI